jgi:hypothetical protein
VVGDRVTEVMGSITNSQPSCNSVDKVAVAVAKLVARSLPAQFRSSGAAGDGLRTHTTYLTDALALLGQLTKKIEPKGRTLCGGKYCD